MISGQSSGAHRSYGNRMECICTRGHTFIWNSLYQNPALLKKLVTKSKIRGAMPEYLYRDHG